MIEGLAKHHRELVYSILANCRQFNDSNAKIIENVVEAKKREGLKKQEIEGKKMEGLKKQQIEEIENIDLVSRYIETRLKETLKPEKRYYATTGEDKYILQKNEFDSYTIPKRTEIPKAKVKEAEIQVSLEDTREKKKEKKTHTSEKTKHATEEKKKYSHNKRPNLSKDEDEINTLKKARISKQSTEENENYDDTQMTDNYKVKIKIKKERTRSNDITDTKYYEKQGIYITERFQDYWNDFNIEGKAQLDCNLYSCMKCENFKFNKNKTDFKNHFITKHAGFKGIYCLKCYQSFGNLDNVRHHLKRQSCPKRKEEIAENRKRFLSDTKDDQSTVKGKFLHYKKITL